MGDPAGESLDLYPEDLCVSRLCSPRRGRVRSLWSSPSSSVGRSSALPPNSSNQQPRSRILYWRGDREQRPGYSAAPGPELGGGAALRADRRLAVVFQSNLRSMEARGPKLGCLLGKAIILEATFKNQVLQNLRRNDPSFFSGNCKPVLLSLTDV